MYSSDFAVLLFELRRDRHKLLLNKIKEGKFVSALSYFMDTICNRQT